MVARGAQNASLYHCTAILMTVRNYNYWSLEIIQNHNAKNILHCHANMPASRHGSTI
jgi:hypothetical protein